MKGWKISKLGDLCTIIAGQSPKGEYYNEQGIGLPFYQGKKEFGKKFIETPQKWTTKVTKEAEEGDILMSVRAPVGPINFATQKICIGRGLAIIRAGNQIDREFLFYGLVFKQAEIKGNKGAVFDSINKSQIQDIPFTYPPLPEQKQIVAILDEAFEGIDAAIANTQKNLANARELFESYLNGVFTRKDEGWVEKTLDNLCYKITDGVHHTPNYTETGIPFLSVKNLTNGFIDFSKTKFISPEAHQELIKRCKPEIDDILYTKVGTTGVAKIVDTNQDFSIFVSVALLKVKEEDIFNKFLEHFLNSPHGREQAKKKTRGMANQNLVIRDIKEIIVFYPTNRAEQKSIVEKIDCWQTETQRLESIYQRKLEALQELKQSILQKAFTGELTGDTAKEVADTSKEIAA